MSNLRGELVHWNDARGFGFIAGDDGQRYFVHISSIMRIATRPRVGDVVYFAAKKGEKQQLEARSVTIAGANPVTPQARRSQIRRELDWQLILALSLLGLLAYLIWHDPLAGFLLLPYAAGGVLTFFVYWLDKRAAEAQAWRVSEATLHGLDLAFGIIGGLLGQAIFRHKTRKTRFMFATLMIGFVHLALLAGLALGEIKLEALPATLHAVLMGQ
ncbi:hypothetical protein ASG47_08350 [Devosia sp. Leaf420]|uniref:DUF1294 domain-containing protein n=1 Tax=Devosia sp. Leaf420 TaxID=1736374 RepID=UPI0007151B35|nr:DUF1294 domain-containing protein [Devosia sp. Leaf420]KQT48353.1 hypothetical protein ASG47_08350 [Devosia sp. Leaf420]